MLLSKKQLIIKTACIVLGFVMQVVLPYQINFLLPICIAFALKANGRLTLPEALICGIACDLVSGEPFGCCLFVFTFGMTLANFTSKANDLQEIFSSIISLILLISICEILRYLIVAFATPNASFIALLSQGGILALLIEIIFGCTLFMFLQIIIKPEKDNYMFGR